MKRIIKLTESDLTRIVKRVIKEEYHENIETTSDDDLRSKLDSYKSEMENFLRELKSSGTEIDKHRFLKQVQKETDQMYWDVYDNSDSEPEGFVELQMDLIKHFRKKLNESYLHEIIYLPYQYNIKEIFLLENIEKNGEDLMLSKQIKIILDSIYKRFNLCLIQN